MGIRYVEVMLTDGAVDTWKNTFGLFKVGVVQDNQFDMIPPGVSTVGTPWRTIVDPRTMEIIAQGASATHGVLQQVAQSNQ